MYTQGKDVEFDSQIDALEAVLASIPEELFHEIELEVHTAEGAATNKQRLEVLREQQELIEDENEQSEKQSEGGKSARVSDMDNIDEKEDEQRPEDALRREHEAEMQAQAGQETAEVKSEEKKA
jgi:LETM1 and EF-hand domain-containing protein 1